MARYFLGADGNQLVERRSTPRFDVALDVDVTHPSGTTTIRGMTRNISESGMLIALPSGFSDGTTLRFAFPSFVGTAQVIWSREEGGQTLMGMRIVSLPPRDREVLLEVIATAKRERWAGLMATRE